MKKNVIYVNFNKKQKTNFISYLIYYSIHYFISKIKHDKIYCHSENLNDIKRIPY